MVELNKAIKNIIKYKYSNTDKDFINIGYGIDDNYARCMAASIASFCINNKNRNFNFHILGLDLSDDAKEKIEILAKQFKININIYEIEKEFFKIFPRDSVYTLPIYFRLILSSILDNVDKIFYVDSDIICLHNAEKFFDIDLENNIIAAIKDSEKMNEERNKSLGLKNHKYFNSGVLIINPKAWNDDNINEKFIDLIENNKIHLAYPDQDILNYLLIGKVKYIDKIYNYIDIKNVTENNNIDIILLHFAAYPKPWHLGWDISIVCNNFNKNIYKFYEEYTPWKNVPLETPYNAKMVRSYVKSLLYDKQYLKLIPWVIKYLKFRIKEY